MPAGICIRLLNGAGGDSGRALLSAECRRLGIEDEVVQQAGENGLLLRLADQRAQEWMPDHDTLRLAATLKLDVARKEDDLLREIWLTLLNSPILLEFPSAEELMAAVRIRRNIVTNAARTCLNFHTSAVERPTDCWRHSEATGFVLIPGSPLIESLKKACQPEEGGQVYAFSCNRATEYVVLLAIAEEARDSHPELLRQLQAQWEKKAVSYEEFQDLFLNEFGSLEEPLPMHYYVPGDRVWFRNPDSHSSDAKGFEGSWVFYLGGGMFVNFWKRDRHFDLLTKCLEIYHWRHAAYPDEKGELQIDEEKVEKLVAETLESPEETARVFERMHRFRDGRGVYAEGGCMDATRETPRFVLPPHSDLIRLLQAL